MMLRLIALETRALLRERLSLFLLLVMLLACALAVANGRALMTGQIEGRDAAKTEAAEADRRFTEQLAGDLKPEDGVILPFRMRMTAIAPVPPLADFSAGRAAFENYSTAVSMRSRPDNLFKRTQPDNPELLARGSFDIGFVAIIVAPLLLIGLGYGVFAADRDSGAAQLVMAQAGTPGRMLAARALPRLALLLLPLLFACAWLLATGPNIAGRGDAAMWWVLTAIALLLLWWATILFVNSFRVGAETAALALVGLWALFTLVLPAAITAGASAAFPPPSRFEQIATARAAEVSSTTAYENDHPDLASDDFAGRLASVRKSLEVGRTVDAALKPVTARFDDQMARQQELVSRAWWIAPPVVAANAMNAAAGTDTASWTGFRQAIFAYLDGFKAGAGRFIEQGSVISAKDYAALPRFQWIPARNAPIVPLLFLILLTAILATAATRRLSKARFD